MCKVFCFISILKWQVILLSSNFSATSVTYNTQPNRQPTKSISTSSPRSRHLYILLFERGHSCPSMSSLTHHKIEFEWVCKLGNYLLGRILDKVDVGHDHHKYISELCQRCTMLHFSNKTKTKFSQGIFFPKKWPKLCICIWFNDLWSFFVNCLSILNKNNFKKEF